MTNKQIETIANEVLQKYVTKGGVYKQFQNIMKTENIKFKEVNSKNTHFVGAFTKGNNGKLYIMVNQNISNEGRKNFTIAHELGHYFLKHQLKNNAFFCYENVILEDKTLQDSIENEANYFATCLLMPEEKIVKAFKAIISNSKRCYNKDFLEVTNKNYSVWKKISTDLTKRYGVSEAALRYRLIYLNLAEFNFVLNF